MRHDNYKKIRVRLTFEIEDEVPDHWDASMVDFHYNDSSWCSDNIVPHLVEYMKAREAEGGCLCSDFHGEQIVEEANDEKR